jgi:hypothetical protein
MGGSTVTEMGVDKSAPCRFVRIADPQAIGAIFLLGRSLAQTALFWRICASAAFAST